MAVDDKLYFLGFMPDHFKGPGNTGPATYQSFDASVSLKYPPSAAGPAASGPYIRTTNSTRYALTASISDENNKPLTDVNIVTLSRIVLDSYCGPVFRDPNDWQSLYTASGVMFLRISPVPYTANFTASIIDPNSGGSISIPIPWHTSVTWWGQGYSTAKICMAAKTIFYINDWGTEKTTIRVVQCSHDGLTIWADGTGTVDTRTWGALGYLKLAAPGYSTAWDGGTGGNDENGFHYAYMCNFDPLRCTFDWYIENTVGSISDWSGDTVPFLTSPITYNVDVHGLYTNSSDTIVTFARPRSFYFPDRHKARIVITQTAGYMGEMGETGVLQPVVKNPTTGIVKPFGDNVTLNDTGGMYTWYSTIDPTTNNPWLKVDETNYEFGIKRIS